eukprot:m.137400 g.137400  ORF g.137400 m.137400 type:complete len:319 (+) comp9929_c0_seq2:420-1376(+)
MFVLATVVCLLWSCKHIAKINFLHAAFLFTFACCSSSVGEFLVLNPRRTLPVPSTASAKPTPADIARVTADLPPCPDQFTGKSNVATGLDVQAQFRSVLAKLADKGQQLQKALAKTEEDDGDADADDAPRDPADTVDQTALAGLISMGFPRNASARALLLNRDDFQSAMEWLLNHSDDPDVDRDLTPPPSPRRTAFGGTFVPDQALFLQLMNLGYTDARVLAAMQLAQNDHDVAVDLLLSDENLEEALEAETSAPENDAVFEEVLKDARFHSGLVDPRVTSVFREISQNPGIAPSFVQHPLIGPLLVAISNALDQLND